MENKFNRYSYKIDVQPSGSREKTVDNSAKIQFNKRNWDTKYDIIINRSAMQFVDIGGTLMIRHRLNKVTSLEGFVYLVPAVSIFLFFIVGPALFVLGISFFHYNILNSVSSRFTGLANYHQVFTTEAFWRSLLNTLYFIIGTVPTGTFFALFIALVLMNKFTGRGIVRVGVFAPYVTPVVATSIIWIWILNPQFGLANGILHAFRLPEVGWLQSPRWAMVGVVLYTLWHGVGFNVVIFMAGLSSISAELREAARIDGANRWQEFQKVIWPLLSPTTVFILIITTITSVQAFTQFYTMTQGGPINATTPTSYLLYQQAFLFFHTSYAAALAVILFLIIIGLTLVQTQVVRTNTGN